MTTNDTRYVSVTRLANMLLLDNLDMFTKVLSQHMRTVTHDGVLCVDAELFHEKRYAILHDYRRYIA